MMVFSIVAVFLAVCALAFLLPPLLARGRAVDNARADATNVAVHRDELAELYGDLRAGTLDPKQHDEARREIERRLLDDVRAPGTAGYASKSRRAASIVLGMAVPLVALLIYAAVGSPEALAPERTAEGRPAVTPQQIKAMVDRLAARLESNPDDATGWVMLGRSYSALGRFSDASAAYANAVQRLPPDGQLLADYAEALAMAQNQRLVGEPERLLARALEADPTNLKARALAGSAAFEKRDFKSAVIHWGRILEAAPPDSDLAESVRKRIAEAQALQ